jgi:hypothetical protein
MGMDHEHSLKQLKQAIQAHHQALEQLERVMNSIRNGIGMRETEIAREPS